MKIWCCKVRNVGWMRRHCPSIFCNGLSRARSVIIEGQHLALTCWANFADEGEQSDFLEFLYRVQSFPKREVTKISHFLSKQDQSGLWFFLRRSTLMNFSSLRILRGVILWIPAWIRVQNCEIKFYLPRLFETGSPSFFQHINEQDRWRIFSCVFVCTQWAQTLVWLRF